MSPSIFPLAQPKPVTPDSNSQQADEQRALDEGVDYFQVEGLNDRLTRITRTRLAERFGA